MPYLVRMVNSQGSLILGKYSSVERNLIDTAIALIDDLRGDLSRREYLDSDGHILAGLSPAQLEELYDKLD